MLLSIFIVDFSKNRSFVFVILANMSEKAWIFFRKTGVSSEEFPNARSEREDVWGCIRKARAMAKKFFTKKILLADILNFVSNSS